MENNFKTELTLNGFVIIDLIDNEDVIYLNKLCSMYLQKGQSDFISSSHSLDKQDSDFINIELHKILDKKFEKQFPDLQLLGGTLATKVKGNSNLVAHQDWTIVDEEDFNSYNLWIPLVNTGKKNGTLGLIPGSHKWNNSCRGLNIPNKYGKYTSKFLQIGIEPELKVGQAILYNHKLIHYSRPNTTGENRNTAIVGAKDRDAELQVTFTTDYKYIETYKVSQDDFYRFDIDKIKNSCTLIHRKELRKTETNWNEIFRQYAKNTSGEYKISKVNNNIFKKIFNLFVK